LSTTTTTEGEHLAHQFGRRLKELRAERSWSQRDLETKSGIERGTIFRLEHGKVGPRLESMNAFAKCFQITLSELLHGVGHQPVTDPLPVW